MDYAAKKCPYCGKEFVQGEDLAQCDTCGALHHSECWKKFGSCATFMCIGKMEQVDFSAAKSKVAPSEEKRMQDGKEGAVLGSASGQDTIKGYEAMEGYAKAPTAQNNESPLNTAEQEKHWQTAMAQAGNTGESPQNAPEQGFLQTVEKGSEPKTGTKAKEVPVKVCSKCRHINTAEYKFCGMCGQELLSGADKSLPDAYIMPEVQTGTAGNVLVECPNCTTSNVGSNTYCGACGFNLTTAKTVYGSDNKSGYAPPQNSQGTVESEQDIRQKYLHVFIGDNSDYYVKRFEKMKATGSANSWNWAAFFLSPAWLFFRKMYKEAAVVIILYIFLSLIPRIGDFLNLGMFIYLGLRGNGMYMRYVDIAMMELRSLPEDKRRDYILKKGGTSTGAALAYVIIVFILRVILVIAFINALNTYFSTMN